MPRSIEEGAHLRHRQLQRALAEKYPGLYPELAAPPSISVPRYKPVDRTALILGQNPQGRPVFLPERARLEHALVIGTTGGGKSKFVCHCVRQDIADGRGVLVVDPHGDHPDSVYRSTLAWCHARGYTRSRIIHLIDPNAGTHTIGFNPLARPDPTTDLSVIAGVTLEAFSRAWGGEDTTNKPTIERVLTATFTALAELGLTLAEAPLLYDRGDRYGIRAWALSRIQDRYAREELRRLHELSLDERRRHDFDTEVVGPINRITRFVRPEAIRSIIGQTSNVLDMRAALDEGHVILANLSGGARVYERDADLLGRLLTRFLFFHAKRRRAPERPFFVYLDECHRYLSGDLENILAEVRKYGVGVMLCTQWLAQLEAQSENMLAAVRSATNAKVVFRIKDPVEAEDLAHMTIPLDLELPLSASVRPTAIGVERVALRSMSRSQQNTTSQSRTENDGQSEGFTESYVESDALTETEGESATESESYSEGEGTSTAVVSSTGKNSGDTEVFDVDGFGFPRTVIGYSASAADSTGESTTSGSSSFSSSSYGSARTHSSSRAQARGTARGTAQSRSWQTSTAQSIGESSGWGNSRSTQEGFKPVYRDLPASFHGKENVLYFAAQTLRNLKTGTAFVNYVDHAGMHATLLSVPAVKEWVLTAQEFIGLREVVLANSPSATPAEDARAAIDERERRLADFACQSDKSSQEPPKNYRTKKKRAPKVGGPAGGEGNS